MDMPTTAKIGLKKPIAGMPGWNEDLNDNFDKLDLNVGSLQEDTGLEIGSVTLTNSMQYPFSNSEKTIALVTARKNLNYKVDVEIVSQNGSAEMLAPYDKQLNGFKLAFVGNASTVTVRYYIQGGIR